MTNATGGYSMPKKRQPINIAEAKMRLPELVDRASRGEEIVIARNGQPQARLVPLFVKPARVPGLGAGTWKVFGDFDAPLPSVIQAAFEGEE